MPPRLSSPLGWCVAEVITPLILYVAVILGAVGVWMALPRKRVNPQIIGGLVAAIAGGLVLIGLGIRAREVEGGLPNLYFYVFAAIALGASLRVITHQRPVYAALYFILTILSSAGLYLILAAEFMAFALIIIYAGAILITYLFVIMMATQSPSEEEVDVLAEYDLQAREPLAAVFAGFLILGALSVMIFTGASKLPGEADIRAQAPHPDHMLQLLPRRVERVLQDEGLISGRERIVREARGVLSLDPEARTAVVARTVDLDGDPAGGFIPGSEREVVLPDHLRARNVESLAYDFLNRHPMTIEIAGVVLLMAMLGAVVLSRRQVDIDDERKRQQAERRLRDAEEARL